MHTHLQMSESQQSWPIEWEGMKRKKTEAEHLVMAVFVS